MKHQKNRKIVCEDCSDLSKRLPLKKCIKCLRINRKLWARRQPRERKNEYQRMYLQRLKEQNPILYREKRNNTNKRKRELRGNQTPEQRIRALETQKKWITRNTAKARAATRKYGYKKRWSSFWEVRLVLNELKKTIKMKERIEGIYV